LLAELLQKIVFQFHLGDFAAIQKAKKGKNITVNHPKLLITNKNGNKFQK